MSAQPGRAVLIPSRDHGWPRSCECTFGRCRSRWPTAGVHAAHVGSDALYYACKSTGRPTSEMTLIDDIPLEAGQTSTGCTSFFLDAGYEALFPFGYGLGYTTFEYGIPVLSATEMTADGSIDISCTVTNTGNGQAAMLCSCTCATRWHLWPAL